MSNWVKILNQMEKNKITYVQDEILEKIIECNYELEEVNEKIIRLVYGTRYKFSDVTRKSVLENIENTEEFDQLINQTHEIINRRACDTKKFKKDISNMMDKIIDETLIRVGSIPREQAPIFKKRMIVLLSRIENFAIEIYQESYNEILKNIQKICELLEVDIDNLRDNKKAISYENQEQLENHIKEIRIKTLNHRDMVKYAENLGYKYERTGRHDIYRHTKSNKSVPIPCHDLGIGLMVSIQKQLDQGVN